MKRAGIYFFYDKNAFVDNYVTYFLKNLQPFFSKLLIVCNGKIKNQEKRKLEEYGEILERENKGFDVWAYKAGIEYLKWDNLYKYDELIMINSTIMGPIYSFKETFNKMDRRTDLDFWGITKYFKHDTDPFACISYGYIPDHIQSHFIAVRKRMFTSKEFKQHWDEMPMIHNYYEAIGLHEAIFTKKFADLGYKWDTSVDMDDLRSYSGYPMIMCPRVLLEKYRCPIFKRRSFFHDIDDILNNTTGEQASDLFEYIDKHTSYDTDMILENIIRTCNQRDIQQSLNLTYTLPTNMSQTPKKNLKLAVIYHVYFTDIIEQTIHYLKSVPENFHVYITTDSEEKLKEINKQLQIFNFEKFEIRIIANRGRDVSSILVGVKDVIMQYDLVCFAHDKKTTQVEPYSIGAGFAYKCLENVLKNKHFVNNVVNTFVENPRLGILSPPEPNHSVFFASIGQEWGPNYENTYKLAEKLGIQVPISPEKPPVAPYGTIFWFRPKAMKLLYDYNWQYSDFPEEPNGIDGTLLHAIERLYPFVVQHAGYFPAIVMNDKFAAIEYNNLRHYTRGYNRILLDEGIGPDYVKMHSILKKSFYEYRHNLQVFVKFRNLMKIIFGKPFRAIKIVYQKIKVKLRK